MLSDEHLALSDRLHALTGDVYPPSDETLTAMCAEIERLRALEAQVRRPAAIEARDAALQVLSEPLRKRHTSPAEREQIARAIAEAIVTYMRARGAEEEDHG